MNNFYDVTALLGSLLRLAGLLVFGFAAGWFTLFAFRQPEKRWELQVAVFLGFLFFTAWLARFTSPGGIGAFGLGAGAALLVWGLRGEISSTQEEEE